MAPGDGDAGGGADRGSTRQNLADGVGRQLVDGHADNGQRQDRGAAHGIDVRQRIGGGDAAKIEGVIDHGHEEVRGGHQGLLIVQTPDGGVVGGFRADQQVGEGRRSRHLGEDFL